MDILITKYLRALISYEGIQRIESLPMPREALREALLNCVVHKAYESLTPIQIAVFDNKLEIWNCGVLPEDWTIDNLLENHRSLPYNPDIANAFFRAGEIEAWGRGIELIFEVCKSAGTPEPQFKYDGGELWTTFFFSKEYQEGTGAIQSRPDADQKKQEEAIIELIKGNPYISRKEIAQQLSIHESSVKRRLVCFKNEIL